MEIQEAETTAATVVEGVQSMSVRLSEAVASVDSAAVLPEDSEGSVEVPSAVEAQVADGKSTENGNCKTI
jgi:hypothetical protein